MFGPDFNNPPKIVKKVREFPHLRSWNLQSVHPGYYQHLGKSANTDGDIRYRLFKRQKQDFEKLQGEEGSKRMQQSAISIKYDLHAEKQKFKRDLDLRVTAKLKAYEETVDVRREKLKELLCKEEREFIRETIDSAQKGNETRLEDMKLRCQQIKAQRESERLATVEEKRNLQFINRCQELRPYIIKKNLIETKEAQLQQMRENEARREADREVERMWHHLESKEIEAKSEKEVQDLLQQKLKQMDLCNTWDSQLKGKQCLKIEKDRLIEEERLELLKISEEIRKNQMEELKIKIQKRKQQADDLRLQIMCQEKLINKRKQEKDAMDKAFSYLTEQELLKEMEATDALTRQLRREADIYNQYLKEMEMQRKEEEKELNRLLELNRLEIQKKEDNAKCTILQKKEELKKEVLRIRQEQIEYKKQEEEKLRQKQQSENEILQLVIETNQKLQQEYIRQQAEDVRQYREDLRRQMEYNKALQERQQSEDDRLYLEGLKEEERYRELIEQLKTRADLSKKHPFRGLLETPSCRCSIAKH